MLTADSCQIFKNIRDMLSSRPKLFNLSRNIKFLSYNHKEKDVVSLSEDGKKLASLLAKLLDIKFRKGCEIVDKNQEIVSINQDDIKKSVEKLKFFNYTDKDIQEKPKVLYVNALTLQNRYEILQESGCTNIPLYILFKYITVCNKGITYLKAHGVIPCDINVQKNLEQSFTDIEVILDQDLGESIQLKLLREAVLKEYLIHKLGATNTSLEKLFKTYGRVKHKSFKSVRNMIDILLNDLNFPKDRVINNGYLLHGDPDNTRRLINEIPSIGNENIKSILYRKPKIIMSPCDSILKTLYYIKKFNIPESAITKCFEVLTLGPETVNERLEDLNSIEEFRVLRTNPRILRLVHYQNKARLRLDYLNQLRVRCASLHILSCGSESFEKFARDGTDKTKGKDIIVFLANNFQKSETEVRYALSRHPNWCHVPVVCVKQCYDFLIKRRFTPDDIYQNIHLIVYPTNRIDEKLNDLQKNETYAQFKLDLNYSEISNRQLLTLCLYLIEADFHFTGDGIWTEQHTQQVENFHNILPDFPASLSKTYKYGTRTLQEKIKEISRVKL